MNNTGIYRIKSPSGKFYVGMTTVGFETRWNQHIKLLKTQARQHHCRGLQFAYNKYGNELEFAVVELLNGYNESYLLKREVFWWDYYNKTFNGMYNGRPTGTGSVFHNETTKAKLSQTQNENFLSQDKARTFSYILSNPHEFTYYVRNPRYSLDMIGKIFELERHSVKALIRRLGLKSEPYRGLKNNPNKVIEDFPILNWYFDEKLSTREIAKRVGCTQPYIIQKFNAVRESDPRFSSVKERFSVT